MTWIRTTQPWNARRFLLLVTEGEPCRAQLWRLPGGGFGYQSGRDSAAELLTAIEVRDRLLVDGWPQVGAGDLEWVGGVC